MFLLSHPNGWGLVEQSILSNALAKAVPSVNLGPGNLTDRVEFVSEAEAAVHFALKHASATSLDRWLAVGLLSSSPVRLPLILESTSSVALNFWS